MCPLTPVRSVQHNREGSSAKVVCLPRRFTAAQSTFFAGARIAPRQSGRPEGIYFACGKIDEPAMVGKLAMTKQRSRQHLYPYPFRSTLLTLATRSPSF